MREGPVDGGGEDTWYDGADDEVPPPWFAGQHLPADAKQMGLTHHVGEGAILDFAGRLDSTKPVHRFTAWALLVVFGLPVVLVVLRLFAAL